MFPNSYHPCYPCHNIFSLLQDAFAKAFVQHYSRISVMLVQSIDSETLSNRVVHVSVQLFSDQDLAYRMTDSFHLLHVMIVSLKNMMKSICVPSTLHGGFLGCLCWLCGGTVALTFRPRRSFSPDQVVSLNISVMTSNSHCDVASVPTSHAPVKC